MSEPKIKFVLRQCQVFLTEEEIKAQANIVTFQLKMLKRTEAEKKSNTAFFKEKLERISVEIDTAARLHDDGYDWADVECAVVKDWDYGEILYIRVDTCELAHVESMTQSERQHHIDEFLGGQEQDAVVDPETGETVNTTTGELKPGHNSGCGAGVGTGQDTGSNEEIKSKQGISKLLTGETTHIN